MWQKLVQAHRQVEDAVLAILLNPEAETAPMWQRFAGRMRQLSVIERRQMYDFASRNRGWAGYRRWLLQPMLVFSLLGLLWHAMAPAKFSVLEGIFLSNCLGLSFGFGLLVTWFNYRKFAQQGWAGFIKVVLLAMAGAFCGAMVSSWVDGRAVLDTLARLWRPLTLAGIGTGGLYALLIGIVSRLRASAYELENARLQAETERERLARQLSDSQLRLLQAQIEPHFLFNTLGAVQQLAEPTAPRAAELTAHLIQFLRGSLNQMRAETVTLTDDFALLEAYLNVMTFRLGKRLRFTLDLPAELAQQRVPSMMLLTLVENAIKHGIEPALRGGEITVRAAEVAGQLQLRVDDTGIGLAEDWHDGVGLANIRDRLRLMFGEQASLQAKGGEGHTGISLQLPLLTETHPAAVAA